MKKTMYKFMSGVTMLTLTLLSYTSVSATYSEVEAQQAANTYYVVSQTGNDANLCTLSAPCKTFNRAQNLAVAGDTIEMSGTFPPIKITKSLTVKGGTYNGAGQSEAICLKIDADNVTVDGVTVINCTSHGIISFKANSVIQNSTVTNSVLENSSRQLSSGWGSCIKGERGASNLKVINNHIEKCYGEGVAITMTLGALVEGNTVIDAYSTLYYIDNSPNVVIRSNYATCTGDPLFNRGSSRPNGIMVGEEYYSGWGKQLHDITISSNTIQGCDKGIMALGSIAVLTNVTLSRNYIPSGVAHGIALDGTSNSNVLVEYNTYFNQPWIRSNTGVTLIGNLIGTTAPATSTPITATTIPIGSPTHTQTLLPTASPTKTSIPVTPTSPTTAQNVVEIRVAAGSDDVEESSTGWMYLDSTDLELVYDGNNQIIGLRFKGVNVPNNAIITNAYIKFVVDETTSNATTLSIRGEANPNAAAFTAADRNVSSRLKTTNAVSWSPASWLTLGAVQQTPNLAPIIQEIIGQSGWVSGNSMVIILSGSGSRVAQAYETDPSKSPLLHIEYSVATSAANTATMTATTIPVGSPTASPTYTSTPVVSTNTPTFTPMPVYTQTQTPAPTNLPSATATAVAPSSTPIVPTEPPQSTEETTPSSTEVIYDNTDAGFIYSPDWVDMMDGNAYNGSYKETNKNGAFVTFTFTGQSFSILYTGGSAFRSMNVYVDDVLVGSINEKMGSQTYQMRWDYSGQLTPEAHSLKLVFVGKKGNNKGSLDAVIVR